VSFKIIMTTSVTRPCFTTQSYTTPDLQDQDRFFLVSDRSCPKTDGLRPHHWYLRHWYKHQHQNNLNDFTRFV